MSQSKKHNATHRVSKIVEGIEKLSNKYLVVKNFVAVMLFVIALWLLSPLSTQSELAKLLLMIYSIIVLGLITLLIMELIVKTVQLQNEKEIKRYSAVVSLNSFFGLVFPLYFANIVLSKAVMYAGLLHDYDTIFCKLRYSLVNFYYSTQVYWKIEQIIFWVALLSIALFFFGGVIEKTKRL